jgi:hypothetical protein
MDAANACMAMQQYEDAAELLGEVAGTPFQVQLGHGPAMPAAALQNAIEEMKDAAQSHQQLGMA